jgi:hypothetical protein
MDNINIQNAIPILNQMQLNPEKLSPERLEALLKITDSIKGPSDITPEITRQMMSIINCSSIVKK